MFLVKKCFQKTSIPNDAIYFRKRFYDIGK